MKTIAAALLFAAINATEVEEEAHEIASIIAQAFTDDLYADDDPCETLKGKWQGT